MYRENKNLITILISLVNSASIALQNTACHLISQLFDYRMNHLIFLKFQMVVLYLSDLIIMMLVMMMMMMMIIISISHSAGYDHRKKRY
jgi:uncharacterized membrane protein